METIDKIRESIQEVGAKWKQKHEDGEITDDEYDAVAMAFQDIYKRMR